MKKKLLFKFFVFAVIGSLLTVTSCKDYDDDINGLDSEISNAKSTISTMQTQLTTLQTALTAAQADATAAKADAAAAKTAADEAKAAAAEAKAAALTAKAEAIQAAADELAALKATLEAAIAKKLDITAFDNAMLLLDARIDGIEDGLGILTGQMTAAEEAIADLVKADTELQIQLDALEIYAEATQLLAENNAADIAKAKADIEATQQEILDLWAQLTADKEELLGLIGENAADIATLFTDLDATNQSIEDLKAEINAELVAIKEDISDIQGDISDIYDIIAEEIRPELVTLGNYVGVLDRQVKSITFVPEYTSPDGTPQILVRGLYEWEARNNYGFNNVTWDTYWLPKPLNNNWSNAMAGDIYKGYTELTYDVNPSNAKLGIDYTVEGLLEQTSTVVSLKSSNEPLLKCVGAEEKGGKLVVRVLVHKDAYKFNTECFDAFDTHTLNYKETYAYLYDPNGHDSGKNVSVALQVKNIKALEESAERYVVSSEYVKSSFMLEPGFIKFVEGETIGEILPMSIEKTAIAVKSYPSNIKLWNGFNGTGGTPKKHIINLNDYIKGIFHDGFTSKDLDMVDYGFEDHKFVFEGIYLNNEGVDETNDYINLNGATGEIDVKFLSDGRAMQAAVGRTPIILVKALVNNKVYAVGYIKIVVTDQFDRSDVPFTFTISDYELDCKSVHSLTAADIAAIDFDQVFNDARVELGKDDFYDEYSQATPEIEGVKATSTTSAVDIDNINDFVSFAWNIDFKTQSGNKKNFLNVFIKNTMPAGTYEVKVRLPSTGYRPDIVITWKFKVTLPEHTLTDNPAILSGNKIIVNPTIVEELQAGKTSAAYEALLNNAFMHSGTSFKFTPLLDECVDALTPYFVFTSAPSGYVIGTNPAELYQAGHKDDPFYLAAVIETDLIDVTKYFIRLNNELFEPMAPGASWGNYAPLTNASKGLVGKSVSVQPRGYINGVTYNWINLRTSFNVDFTYPLVLKMPTDAAVYDQSDEGLNQYTLNLYDPVALVDWKGREVNINSTYGRSLFDHYEVGTGLSTGSAEIITGWTLANLFFQVPGSEPRPGHLGFWYPELSTVPTTTYRSPFIFDTDNAKCNISTGGTIVSDITYPIPAGMELKYNTVAAAGSVTVITNSEPVEIASTFAFTWENGFTGAVQEEFKIAIPVSVVHKWGTVESKLIITVKPGIGPSNP